MIRPDDIARRGEGLPHFADLREGGNLRPRRRGLPWGTIILFAGVLILFTALGCTMAPRVVAQADACRPDCAVGPTLTEYQP